MREILFRGKRTDNGEWVEGYFVSVNSKCYIGQEVTENTKSVSCLNGTWYGFDNFYEVIPETVGQFTGLTDKNGKKIWEGDIVKVDERIFNVVWDEKKALFYLENRIVREFADFYYYFGYDLEIIGNIHDNSEILKGGAEE